MSYTIRTTKKADFKYAATLSNWYIASSQERGTGIATRTVEYIQRKMRNGNAVIALDDEEIIGFCYVEVFEGKKYVSNSGLIVRKDYRGQGLSTRIKEEAFHLARKKYPNARVFGITTSDIVMKINTRLGYRAVAFHKLTRDDTFWSGCSSCPNYDILMRNNKAMCLCTGMLAKSLNESKKSDSNNEQGDK